MVLIIKKVNNQKNPMIYKKIQLIVNFIYTMNFLMKDTGQIFKIYLLKMVLKLKFITFLICIQKKGHVLLQRVIILKMRIKK